MYIDRNILSEYPFEGKFYRFAIDESKPLDEQVEEEILVLSTMCDITENSSTNSGNFISSKYSVFLPFDVEGSIDVRNGDTFESYMYGLHINGKVVGLFPSQLGGMVVYIQDLEV